MNTITVLVLVIIFANISTFAQLAEPSPPLGGWNILKQEYVDNRHLDGFSLEWDYFMVHTEAFTGIVGYVLADPRGRLGRGPTREEETIKKVDLTPAGGSLAVVGKFFDNNALVSNFRHFGIQGTTASATQRSFQAVDNAHDEYANMEPTVEGGLHLSGKSADTIYDFMVTQDWTDRPAIDPVSSTDIATIPGEFWTVNMCWPRTRLVGQITRLSDRKTFDIDGHGYRENSFGRWAFPFGGWDFAIVSDETSGVQFAWQSYYKSKDLDTLDVSFVEGGGVKTVHFTGSVGEVGWKHNQWHFDRTARQCVPDDVLVVADNGEYRVEANVDIGRNQIPLLSDTTIITDAYLIQEWLPVITGTITNVITGDVTTFGGQGGGEISMLRTFLGEFRFNWFCTFWGRLHFNTRIPKERD